MKDKLLEIINYYGIMEQLKYIHSEYFELDEAIVKYESYPGGICKALKDIYKEHIVEEIADIMVMLRQIQYYYEIEDKEVKDKMEYKINRQLERINNEISSIRT